MKTQSILLSLSFILFSFFSFAQTKTAVVTSETIKVWGNCGMCKAHIEKAAKEAGATAATWNKDTKILSVKYDMSKTSNTQIQESVANAGYDTKDFTAKDGAYKKLDECCQYERKATATDKKAEKKTDKKKALTVNCCGKNEICDKSVCNSSNMACCKNAAVKHDCYKNPVNSCCAKS